MKDLNEKALELVENGGGEVARKEVVAAFFGPWVVMAVWQTAQRTKDRDPYGWGRFPYGVAGSAVGTVVGDGGAHLLEQVGSEDEVGEALVGGAHDVG